jgi:glycosyltransferase involved in cell wall biosynthesis
MPIALLEAMASGCAVVATDVGDVRQMLPASQHPFVVQREDAQALAAALATIAGSSSLRDRLGADNRKRAEERYEAEQCFDRFASVYSSVCAKASVSPGATSRSQR